MPEIPAPAARLRALAPLWPPLYTALEWATQQTRAYSTPKARLFMGTWPRVRPLPGQTVLGPAGRRRAGGGGRRLCLSDAAQ